ncbi:CAP domain-containing protein [Paludifilum halophilum]|uniref:SCP domain-containing protein n=1 Tax=Paludifilum halophilum TaxID=1642702 RepID=A0A235B7N0_9BACL|nr:CAP domain-containing protein [Paludifilum halophilum]OYD08313.1 hypothetical protein CHM34_05550 [Paludifilum halophilum]
MRKIRYLTMTLVFALSLGIAGMAPLDAVHAESEASAVDRITSDSILENFVQWIFSEEKEVEEKHTEESVQPTPAVKHSPDSSGSSKSSSSDHKSIQPIEQKVVELVNQERSKRGLKPLKADAELSAVARDKSQDMAENHYFSHQSPTYGSPFDMMKDYGIQYRTAGENIAAGQTSAEQVVQGWMNSDGHRKNILNPEFTTIGVGYVKGGSYGHYWTQMFTG